MKTQSLEIVGASAELLISPRVGEMGGSPEGGAVLPTFGARTGRPVEHGRSMLPPSALPGISPARGEIGSACAVAIHNELPSDVASRDTLLDKAMGPRWRRKSSEKLRRGRLPSAGLAFVARDGDGSIVGTVRLWDVAMKLGISPREGEMSGRTEGGAVPPTFQPRLQDAGLADAGHSTLPPSGLPAISPSRGEIGSSHVGALLLGPLAVDPALKNAGIGSALMRHAIEEARRFGHSAILLVGDAPYYARFGFSAAKTGLLAMPGPYERHRLLALELVPGALDGAQGTIVPTSRKAKQESTKAAA